MKKVLICGSGSYIGGCFTKHVAETFKVDEVNMRDENWTDLVTSNYDAVVFLAGIVHIKERAEMESQYLHVNCDLAYEAASIAKEKGIHHFVFMSTKGVYAPNTALITNTTEPCPRKLYGKSKLAGEIRIETLSAPEFVITIVRAPTVYGKKCKGNYPKLSRLSQLLPIIPDVACKRSFIYVENLCEFLKQVIEQRMPGVLYPQDTDYVCTTNMMELIANAHGKKVIRSKMLGKAALYAAKFAPRLRTMFYDSVYDKSLSDYGFKYSLVSLKEAIKKCEE